MKTFADKRCNKKKDFPDWSIEKNTWKRTKKGQPAFQMCSQLHLPKKLAPRFLSPIFNCTKHVTQTPYLRGMPGLAVSREDANLKSISSYEVLPA